MGCPVPPDACWPTCSVSGHLLLCAPAGLAISPAACEVPDRSTRPTCSTAPAVVNWKRNCAALKINGRCRLITLRRLIRHHVERLGEELLETWSSPSGNPLLLMLMKPQQAFHCGGKSGAGGTAPSSLLKSTARTTMTVPAEAMLSPASVDGPPDFQPFSRVERIPALEGDRTGHPYTNISTRAKPLKAMPPSG